MSFNGAAAFQPRNLSPETIPQMTDGKLQWGRSISAAEFGKTRYKITSPVSLQWGRSISAAEFTTTANMTTVPIPALQWGRSISAAEFGGGRADVRKGNLASMGPQHFSRGIKHSLAAGR